MSERTTFKRVEVGANFISGDSKFRKCGNKVAFRLLQNGTGQTHKKITFSRSASVVTVP